MKTLKIWSLVALMFVGLTACNGESKEAPAEGLDKIVNEWVLATWGGENAEYTVYIDFNEDNTFAIYQQVYTLNYEMYAGTYSISGNTLSGVYSDGSAWKCDYIASMNADGTVLTLVSNETESTTGVYDVTVIPEDVKAEATATRGVEVEGVPFL